MKAIFELDDSGHATGIVHPLHDSCLEMLELRGLENEMPNIMEKGQPYAISSTDESQHDEHHCVVCGEPMRAA